MSYGSQLEAQRREDERLGHGRLTDEEVVARDYERVTELRWSDRRKHGQ